MTTKLMHSLVDISSYIFEEMTDGMKDEQDLGRRFWAYVKSNLLNDSVKKIKVSDYIYSEILKLDVDSFNSKYNVKLDNVKKSKEQITFVCSQVALMFQFSDKGCNMIEWS